MTRARGLLLAAVVLSLLTTLASRELLRGFDVPSSAMEPSVNQGDRILVRTDGSGDRGQVVVYEAEQNAVRSRRVSRVVAVAGDTIEVVDGGVVLNGEVLDEDYLDDGTETRPDLAEQTVAEGFVYLLSDNRPNAQDSRRLGPVPTDRLVGPVWFTNVPVDTALVFLTGALALMLLLSWRRNPDRPRPL